MKRVVVTGMAGLCPLGSDWKTVSEGLGGFGNASTEGTLVVSGDRSRSEDLVTYT